MTTYFQNVVTKLDMKENMLVIKLVIYVVNNAILLISVIARKFAQKKLDMMMGKNTYANQNVITVEKIAHCQHILKKEIINVQINVLYHMKRNMIHIVVKTKLVQFNVQFRIVREDVKV